MSTSVCVKYYIGENQIGKNFYVNKLKTLLVGWNFADIDTVENPVVDNAGEYWYNSFYGYLPVEKVSSQFLSRTIMDNGKLCLYLVKGEDMNCSDFIFPTIEQIQEENFFKKNVSVFYYEKEEYNGNWYNSNSFYTARLNYEKQLKEHQDSLLKLKSIKDSFEYYKLNEDQKESLNEDIDFHQEISEELSEKIYMCQYMIDTLSLLSDTYSENNEECLAYIYIC